MSKKNSNGLTVVLISALLIISVSAVILSQKNAPGEYTFSGSADGIAAFHSEGELKTYLAEVSQSSWGNYYGGVTRDLVSSGVDDSDVALGVAQTKSEESAPSTGNGDASRYSETNVQVLGIDEPDIVKTDGENIYLSSEYGYYWRYPHGYVGQTEIISAFPVEDMEIRSEIEDGGKLLLSGDTLIIFSNERITGYDVSDSESPEKAWSISMNSTLVDARLFGGKVYIVTRKSINYNDPYPIIPLTYSTGALEIKYDSIYHPVAPVQTDVTYNVIMIDPEGGEAEKAVSFMGSGYSSVVYMSESGIYITYQKQEETYNIYYSFVKDACIDLLPADIIAKLEKIDGYDISYQSKNTELSIILQEYKNTLDADGIKMLENEMSNRMEDYFEAHKRDFVKTGIIRFGTDLSSVSDGEIPGVLLNQFSLDEYGGYLRAATTISGSVWGYSGESCNDIYVLDGDFGIVGSVKDLGLTERIYSARFLGDRGYVVTFRQTDPFYVLDLSDPSNPQMKGELKIPGYSSYLHPVSGGLILGIGRDDSNVKVSLFDASNPEDPQEISKYRLDEYWSDILNTHHAFLMDKDKGIFFLPGSSAGYVFSYSGNEIKMVKAVSGISAQRAVYIEDCLYIIGNDKIVVLDESTWDRVNELEIDYGYPDSPIYRDEPGWDDTKIIPDEEIIG